MRGVGGGRFAEDAVGRRVRASRTSRGTIGYHVRVLREAGPVRSAGGRRVRFRWDPRKDVRARDPVDRGP